MAEQEKDRLMDHDADGIKEYDNNLPRCWLNGFYFTIIMSVIYIFYFELYAGPDWNFLWYEPKTQEAEYAAEGKALESMMASAPKEPSKAAVLLTDAASLSKGKEIFNSTNSLCMTCHRKDLGGLVGPNLTDEYWIHGCSIEEIVKNIITGFPEKGMLPYGSSNKLSDDELLQVASYIISMKGTNPPEPKPIEERRDVECGEDDDDDSKPTKEEQPS
jgi:cytochrome c oxidase cbb3-type subunit 3